MTGSYLVTLEGWWWWKHSSDCSLSSAETGPFWVAWYQNVFVVTLKNRKIFQFRRSAFKGKTEHPGSFALSTASSAGETAVGEMGKFSLVGMSVCFPLPRSGILKVYPATPTNEDICWITSDKLCLVAARISEPSSKDKSWKMPNIGDLPLIQCTASPLEVCQTG